ncbi:MAG: plastocyanin/azurin family copper-binding protein [Bacteroidota bacterium]
MKRLLIHICLLFTGVCFSVGPLHAQVLAEGTYYPIETVTIPSSIVLEVGGLAFDAQGALYASTRRGEIWKIKDPASSQPRFSRFAHGMHEILGLSYKDGSFYFTQRGELNKVTDTQGDGIADRYETIYRWPLTGNYHEYSYGPKFLSNGDMIVTLNLSWIGHGASLSKWRGWMLRISPDGEMTPWGTGMRSPSGFGFNDAEDIFYTENQGDWVGSGRMTHIAQGDFAGHPEGLKWSNEPGSPLDLTFEDVDDTQGISLYEYGEKVPAVKPPAVWFPHTIMGIATSDILLIENDKQVGPFKGQLLVGDQGHSKITRVALEKVEGVYQGAVFGFREGFSSGILRLEWSPNKKEVYVGMTARGWRATGGEPFGLQRMKWSGRVPFEIHSIHAESDGFTLKFTQNLDPQTAANPESYEITDFTYKYHHNYGSPPINQEGKTISRIELGEDKKTVRLYIPGLRQGYVNEIKAEGVRSQGSQALLHNVGYFTLNRIPGGAAASASSEDQSTTSERSANVKRNTQMPPSWGGKADVSLTLGTKPGLIFDQEKIVVKAGNKVELTFNNNDDMLHNFLLVSPNQADEVGNAAMKLGLKGEEMAYVPEMEEVIYHTGLLEPGSSEVIYFEAPTTPGEYPYVCTFPGHFMTMRGILKVE